VFRSLKGGAEKGPITCPFFTHVAIVSVISLPCLKDEFPFLLFYFTFAPLLKHILLPNFKILMALLAIVFCWYDQLELFSLTSKTNFSTLIGVWQKKISVFFGKPFQNVLLGGFL